MAPGGADGTLGCFTRNIEERKRPVAGRSGLLRARVLLASPQAAAAPVAAGRARLSPEAA